MEIKLFANFINDIKKYKQDRTGFDIQNDYWFPKVSYLCNIIKKEIIDVDFTLNNIYRIQKILYQYLSKKVFLAFSVASATELIRLFIHC